MPQINFIIKGLACQVILKSNNLSNNDRKNKFLLSVLNDMWMRGDLVQRKICGHTLDRKSRVGKYTQPVPEPPRRKPWAHELDESSLSDQSMRSPALSSQVGGYSLQLQGRAETLFCGCQYQLNYFSPEVLPFFFLFSSGCFNFVDFHTLDTS